MGGWTQRGEVKDDRKEGRMNKNLKEIKVEERRERETGEKKRKDG